MSVGPLPPKLSQNSLLGYNPAMQSALSTLAGRRDRTPILSVRSSGFNELWGWGGGTIGVRWSTLSWDGEIWKLIVVTLTTPSPLFYSAARAAKKAKLRESQAAAHHNLMIVIAHTGQPDRANGHAAFALQLYRPNDERFPHFIHDLGYLWQLQRFFSVALEVLHASLSLFESPEARYQILANIAEAAGARKDLDRFFDAWEQMSRVRHCSGEYEAAGLLSLAEGALRLRLTSQAFQLALEAVRVGRIKNIRSDERRAELLLERIRDLVEPEPEQPAPPSVIATAADLLSMLGSPVPTPPVGADQ
jgi:tetratricopeptide (TPR) repeat protein